MEISHETGEGLPKSEQNIAPVTVRPFIKWAGGKTGLLPELLSLIPERFKSSAENTYFEPFVGSGALFFALNPSRPMPQKAVLSDCNAELINLYTVVRDNVEELIQNLGKHRFTESYFYKVRAQDRSADYWVRSPLERASRFLFLNKTCFNGLYRVNSRGEFNVPYGDYDQPNLGDPINLRRCSEVLKSVELCVGSFQDVGTIAKGGDFVYFDPPYVPLSTTSSFTSYTKEGFGPKEQEQLVTLCQDLDRNGVLFLLSNSDSEITRALYKGFELRSVMAARAINSRGAGRGKISELLVSNY
jgi:DNA adenine methylase